MHTQELYTAANKLAPEWAEVLKDLHKLDSQDHRQTGPALLQLHLLPAGNASFATIQASICRNYSVTSMFSTCSVHTTPAYLVQDVPCLQHTDHEDKSRTAVTPHDQVTAAPN